MNALHGAAEADERLKHGGRRRRRRHGEDGAEPACIADGQLTVTRGETDRPDAPRGLLVAVLRASGRPIYPINPMSVARYRERTSMSGKKSDHADAVTLANILRTDADQHRRLPPTPNWRNRSPCPPGRIRTPPGGAPAPATHCGRCCGSITRVSCIPSPTAPAESPHPKPARCWPSPPTPAKAARLSQPQIVAALRRAGRQRGLTTPAVTIHQQLRLPQLDLNPLIAQLYCDRRPLRLAHTRHRSDHRALPGAHRPPTRRRALPALSSACRDRAVVERFRRLFPFRNR